MSLQNVEEILALQDSIFSQVGAVHDVLHLVGSEVSSKGVGPDVLGDFWVVRAHELPEGGDDAFLPDLEGN